MPPTRPMPIEAKARVQKLRMIVNGVLHVKFVFVENY